MDNYPIIKVESVTKIYKMYSNRGDRLLEALDPFRRCRHTPFAAVDNISLIVNRGEALGIVGVNGSGKSTLLKLLSRVLTPTSGTVTVNGTISALLELGAGFNPDRSGIDNLYFQGAVQGYSIKETKEMIPHILEFADIGDFIYQPVKTYSSGMFVRLAFAAAIQSKPDILIVDEALAVGDVCFQRRCFRKIEELKKQGVTFIFVSHSSEQIITHCSRAVLLSTGKIIMDGEPKAVVNKYLDILFGKCDTSKNEKKPDGLLETRADASPSKIDDLTRFLTAKDPSDNFSRHPFYNPYEYRWGNNNAQICDVYILSDNDVNHIRPGDKLKVYVKAYFKEACFRPIWGFTLKNREGLTVYGSNSEINSPEILHEFLEKNSLHCVCFSFQCNLAPGQYFISLGLACNAGETPIDRRYDSLLLTVNGPANFFGLSELNMTISDIEGCNE